MMQYRKELIIECRGLAEKWRDTAFNDSDTVVAKRMQFDSVYTGYRNLIWSCRHIFDGLEKEQCHKNCLAAFEAVAKDFRIFRDSLPVENQFEIIDRLNDVREYLEKETHKYKQPILE
jgi:hypothetical protein